MAKDNFRRYIWLIDTIRSAGHITRAEIERRWLRSALNEYGEPLSERTFHNHKNAISEIFGIEIKYEGSLGYYIDYDKDVEDGSIKEWMLDSLSVNNILNEGGSMHDCIIVESVPSSHKWMTVIIEAIKDRKTIMITHQGFKSPEPYTVEVHPYCLKLFKRRWYVLGKKEDKLKIYGLDRIKNIETTNHPLIKGKAFDALKFFSNYYGVIFDKDKVETVDLKVYDYHANYIETLPLHHTQRIIERNDKYTIFRYDIVPTFDFKQEILAKGPAVEVLEPEWFRREIIEDIIEMHGIYGIDICSVRENQ